MSLINAHGRWWSVNRRGKLGRCATCGKLGRMYAQAAVKVPRMDPALPPRLELEDACGPCVFQLGLFDGIADG